MVCKKFCKIIYISSIILSDLCLYLKIKCYKKNLKKKKKKKKKNKERESMGCKIMEIFPPIFSHFS